LKKFGSGINIPDQQHCSLPKKFRIRISGVVRSITTAYVPAIDGGHLVGHADAELPGVGRVLIDQAVLHETLHSKVIGDFLTKV
jgi:hypothetical protein